LNIKKPAISYKEKLQWMLIPCANRAQLKCEFFASLLFAKWRTMLENLAKFSVEVTATLERLAPEVNNTCVVEDYTLLGMRVNRSARLRFLRLGS
jgi:hypothetical protein